MKNPILEIIAPEAGQTESWCHLAPIGTFEYKQGETSGKQLLDSAAFKTLIANFTPSVLVDREHLSLIGDDSTAMGWIEALEIRELGLYALIRWTDVGLSHVANRRLRWLSPVWPPLDADGRPTELVSAGLTNTARFKKELNPVVNKGDHQPTQKEPTMDWTKLLALLGLPADATPEQAAEKVAELQESILAANKAAEDAALTAEGEKVASENEEKIANKNAFVKAFVANKAAALACLLTIKAPAKPTVTNKAEAKAPTFMAYLGSTQVLNKLEQFNAMPDGSAKAKFQTENACELLDLARTAKG